MSRCKLTIEMGTNCQIGELRPLFSPEEVRKIEKLAYREGMDEFSLMKLAAKQVWLQVKKIIKPGEKIIVFAGMGNNGGDGFMTACFASRSGFEVQVRYLGDLEHQSTNGRRAYQNCLKEKIPVVPFESNEEIRADLFLDALLGIGFQPPLRSDIAEAIAFLNQQTKPVISIDLPSGLDGKTGAIDSRAVKANLTITFFGLKLGLLMHEGYNQSGRLQIEKLGLDKEIQEIKKSCKTFLAIPKTEQLLVRPETSHKGNFGHVAVIAGPKEMLGAAILSARAALRAGAGLVTLFAEDSAIGNINCYYPELICRSLTLGRLEESLTEIDVVILGPGLGQSKAARRLLKELLLVQKKTILDADALNLLAQNELNIPRNSILTPHPKEAARLLACSVEEIQKDRYQAARSLSRKYQSILLLKGCKTILADPDDNCFVIANGNPFLATAGMGDLLAGIIGAMWAQKNFSPLKAAIFGASIHGDAGDRAAKELKWSLIASDLLNYLVPLTPPQPDCHDFVKI